MPEDNDVELEDFDDEIEEEGSREPDFVEIGGSPLPGLTLRHVLRGHTDKIARIAWSPDGMKIAAPLHNGDITIWDIAVGKKFDIPKTHEGDVNTVAWLDNSQLLASGSDDGTVKVSKIIDHRVESTQVLLQSEGRIFRLALSLENMLLTIASEKYLKVFKLSIEKAEIKTEEILSIASKSSHWFMDTAWLANSGRLAIGSNEDKMQIYNTKSDEMTTSEGLGNYYSLVCSPDAQILAVGTSNGVVELWDISSGKQISNLEGHTNGITNLSFSPSGKLLASKSYDNTVRIWHTQGWALLHALDEQHHHLLMSGLAFHPYLPMLATLGEKDTIIRIWEMDETVLLGQAKENVNYTTAKLVLVGDSGVGKTGLGWRLAHGEFKEHASTHGQQFWSIPELNLKREDGTDCEAVLWDLAGQHVYRQVHSIFLDNVSAALVLFDPTNRQDPLKGAQFWLEQLKGKGKLPPTVLVGARVDRGAPALSQAELDQFCQRYGIAGGYISTSAMKGDGLDELMELLKKQIPWDEMTATVTTVTFKKIKDYVLSLKEKPDRKGVLVSPQELRKQLEGTDKDWEFTDAEMMTAVGHLETHGYVFILHNSAGEQFILLSPDVLVNLAASIMLLADKNARELGAVSETDLLEGKVPFDELKGLEKAEQQILIDAAILRFLEHSICFRETLNDDTLLIFPSLIKQKRPLQDDLPSTDDISYVVRGRVENIYASLVVLLGYTPSFTRINQWQNQAQYEMKEGELCGFRSIEEREGEIELVLYYGEKMPQGGRDKFQELFEQFLYQREVEITRFPPVVCKNSHQQKRSTVVERAKEGKTFVFCDECGDKVILPDFEKPQTIGIGASPWLQREEAMARLRSLYEKHLTNIKSYRRGWASPRVFISRLSEQNQWAEKLVHDLRDAGVYIVEKPEDLKAEDFAIILDTSEYRKAFQASSSVLANDAKVIRSRLTGGNKKLLSLACEGSMAEHNLKQCTPGDFCDDTHYSVSLFNLLLELYAIPLNHKGFEPLRKSLHEQWEQSLARKGAKEMKSALKVFISYSHKDEEFKEELVTMLAGLQRRGVVDAWQDRRIEAGDEWLKEIEGALDTCDMAVLLVSADFLASRFITEKELPVFIKRREKEGMIVVPIFVRDCMWRSEPFIADLQGLPADGKAVITFPKTNGDRDRIWMKIAEEIERRAKEKSG